MTKTWQFELNIEPIPFGADISEPRQITTFVYSDTGKDIEQRFIPRKVSNIKEQFLTIYGTKSCYLSF